MGIPNKLEYTVGDWESLINPPVLGTGDPQFESEIPDCVL